MKPPAIPEQPILVLPDEALRRLFAICAGKDFEARRDTAMIMLLLDSGARRAELVGLRVAPRRPGIRLACPGRHEYSCLGGEFGRFPTFM
jgi:integrase